MHGSQEAENQLVTNYYQTLQKDVVSSKERIPESGVKRLRIETGKYESNATSPFRFPSADFAM